MALAEVAVRAYKEMPLGGGTLVVSVPHGGIGNILLTDFLLEQLRMDQLAALDAPAFPPLAMVRRGRARFPVRIHADPRTRIAVLRCEFTPPSFLVRPMAAAVLAWARQEGLVRIVVLDAYHAATLGDAPAGDQAGDEAEGKEAGPGGHRDAPRLRFSASRASTREEARKAGVDEFGEGVLDGLAAVLLLEARFLDVDVLAVLSERRGAIDDARSVMAFARVLPRLVRGLTVDVPRLEAELAKVEGAVRAIREAATKAAEQALAQDRTTPQMYC